MSTDLLLVLGLLVSAIVMFAINRPRMDVVGLLMLTLLPFTGVISMGEALAGFSDPNIVLIAALFVLGNGLVRTGVARALGDFLIAKTGKSETKLLILLMIVVCGLGSTMSSTAVTAIFIPVVLRVAQTTGLAPGRLMMPLSFAALISGMMTLVATAPNLVVNGELMRHGGPDGTPSEGFHFFAFTPFGVPLLALAIVYMLVVRRWLPSGSTETTAGGARAPSLSDWIKEYELADREYRVRITPASPLAGASLSELGLRGSSGINVLGIERAGRRSRELLRPTSGTTLQAGDVLLVDLFEPNEEIEPLRQRLGLEAMPLAGAYFKDRSQDLGMAEVMVPAESPLIGKTIVEAQFRSRTGLTVLGMKRQREAQSDHALDKKLKIGDTFLVVGSWKDIQRVRPQESGVLILRLPIELDEVLPVAGKAPHAVISLGLVIALMVTGLVPNVQAALLGCLLMGALGCIDLVSAYRAIDWKTLILIVGMLPFATALQATGGVELAADGLVQFTQGAGSYVIMASIFAVTAILGMFISNTATAVLMAPVALAVARELGASPYPFAMIVALAASTAFVTPVSSPVNTLVVTPGNYTFGDFVRIGGPFALVVLVVSVILVPWLLPL